MSINLNTNLRSDIWLIKKRCWNASYFALLGWVFMHWNVVLVLCWYGLLIHLECCPFCFSFLVVSWWQWWWCCASNQSPLFSQNINNIFFFHCCHVVFFIQWWRSVWPLLIEERRASLVKSSLCKRHLDGWYFFFSLSESSVLWICVLVKRFLFYLSIVWIFHYTTVEWSWAVLEIILSFSVFLMVELKLSKRNDNNWITFFWVFYCLLMVFIHLLLLLVVVLSKLFLLVSSIKCKWN